MNIEVHFTTQLRTALGAARETVSVDEGATLDQLLRRLAADHPQAFAKLVFDSHGKLLPNILLCVGDQQVVHPQSHVLQDGTSVTILSAISGG